MMSVKLVEMRDRVATARRLPSISATSISDVLELGMANLEAALAAGETLHVKVVGLARIASDVTPELALQTIGSLTVLGALQASPPIKAALAARIK